MEHKLYFNQQLQEAVILKRPNRFIMEVLMDNSVEKCHCPCTGRIGDIQFNTPIPCLLSHRERQGQHKTRYTVEAISLNNPSDPQKKWIGINQTKANGYMEYFLSRGWLDKMITLPHQLEREKHLGRSKLDFLIDGNYLEVKTPLVHLQLPQEYTTNDKISIKHKSVFNSTDRFIKHLNDLSASLHSSSRAWLISFFMHEAEEFNPPKSSRYNEVYSAVNSAQKKGVELWQVNSIFEQDGIALANYQRMFI